MKKLASVLISFAIAFGLMVPAVALADDGIGNVAIDYNGQRINLKPQIDEQSHSLMVKFQVMTDDAKYQNFVSTGFTLSSDARSGRIAQSDASGSTVTAVVSNGESPLRFSGDTFFLGTLTVNVNAKLGAGDSTAARIVVSQMDSTDESFGSPSAHALSEAHDYTSELLSVEARTVPLTLAANAFTGSTTPVEGGTSPQPLPGTSDIKPSTEVIVTTGQMIEGTSVDEAALKSVGSNVLQKVKEQLETMLSGQGVYAGLTGEQLQKIAEVIEAAGGDLSLVDVAVTPSSGELTADEAKGDVSLLSKKIPNADLLSLYNLGVSIEVSIKDDPSTTTGPLSVTELTEPITFTVKVPEGRLATMDVAVGFVHNGEAYAISQGVKPILQSSTVEFPASKFSTYAVYGKAKSAVPTTGPVGSLIQSSAGNPALLIGFGALAIIGFAGAIITARRRRAQLSQ